MAAPRFDRLVADLRRSLEPAAQSDAELLADYIDFKSAAAFEAIVRRHGPAVLATCQKVLPEADADDAFQATFLTLAREAGRVRTALGGWLVVVAHRTAVRQQVAARRRATVEARHHHPTPGDHDPSWREACDALHLELDRLPAQYREPLVLCYLRGLSRDEAAAELGLPLDTVRGRLERGRLKLRRNMERRGITLSAGLLAAVVAPGQAVVCRRLVVSATGAVGSATRTVAWRGALAAVAAVAVGVFVAVGAVEPPPTASEPPRAVVPDAKVVPKDEVVRVRGRVTGPDGKAVAWARLHVITGGERKAAPQETAGADGSFAFSLPATAGLSARYVVATAPRLGCDWAAVPAWRSPSELNLRLPEDVPATGRLIDLEGRPVRGATVRLESIDTTEDESLDEFLRLYDGRQHEQSINVLTKRLSEGKALGGLFSTISGTDGRFEIRGIGKNRIPGFIVTSEGHGQQAVRMVTRPGFRSPFDARKHQFRIEAPGATVVLPPDRRILGKVVDHETKRPIGGARMVVLFEGRESFLRQWHSVQTTTDANGECTLRGVGKQKETIVLVDLPADRGYLHHYQTVPDSGGLTPAILNVELRRGVVVEGQIRDRDTRGAVRAHVAYQPLEANGAVETTPGYRVFGLEPDAVDDQAETDANGRFRLTALPGPGVLFIRTLDLNRKPYPSSRLNPKDKDTTWHVPFPKMPDFVVFKTGGRGGHLGPESVNAYIVIDAKPGETVRIDHALWAGHSRKLRVLDPDGKAVTGFNTIGLQPMDGKVAVDGEAIATGLDPEKPRPILIRHPGRQLSALIRLGGGEPEPVEVRLQPTATVTGRLLGKDGQPFAGFTLRPSYHDHPIGTVLNTERIMLRPEKPVVSDAAGRFRYDGLPAGLRVILFAEKAGAGSWSSKEMKLGPGEVKDLGEVRP